MTVNKLKGEHKLTLAGKEYKARLIVLYNGLRGGGNDVSEADVKNIIGESYLESITAVAQLLTKTLTGHSEEETDEGK